MNLTSRPVFGPGQYNAQLKHGKSGSCLVTFPNQANNDNRVLLVLAQEFQLKHAWFVCKSTQSHSSSDACKSYYKSRMNNGKPSPPEDQAVLLEICNILKRHEELLFHSMVETQSLVFILKEYLVKFDERLEAKNVEIAVELKPAYDILLHSLDAIIARLHS